MLQELLAEIRSGGTFETSVLAARLGTTPQLVEAALEHLQRMGYVRTYHSCGDECGKCSLRSGCHVPRRGRDTDHALRLFIWAPGMPEPAGRKTHPSGLSAVE